MTNPFLNLFQKAKALLRNAPVPTAAPGQPTKAGKPSSERLSKTVMPNTVRTMAPPDPFDAAASGTQMTRPMAGSTTRQTPMGGRSLGLPPVVALALEPKIERTISLQLSDIVAQIPSGYVKPAETFDAARRIFLKASEIEKGMASGKPAISLTALYEQVPEIFLHSVPASESTPVPLPYDKVLEQFSSAQVRTDQERDPNVPQMETPFLLVTMEDTERFGTTMEPLQTSAHPPVKVEPAIARTLAAAEPEPASRSTTPTPAPISAAPEPPRVQTPDPSSPTRIPFQLPPNGTGASASERVPASSGPPVPTRPEKAPPSSSGQAPFKVRPPSDDLRPKLTLVPGFDRSEQVSPPPKSKPLPGPEIKVAVSLRSVLQNIPPFQLNGDPSSVPENLRVEFPLSLIQPQLATCRVAIAPKTFQAAMPERFRELLVIDPGETPVLLPLQDVLKNLPGAALQMREDQQAVDTGGAFETPFAIKAREDAQRFSAGEAPAATAPAAEPAEAAAPEKIDPPSPGYGVASKEKIDIGKIDKVEVPATPAVEEPKLEAKEVVARAMTLAGVRGCSVTFSDGLILAGNFPDEVAVEGLCAMAPSLLQRIEKHMLDTNLGALNALTIHGEKSAITFFMQGHICLTALHSDATLTAEAETKLAEMAKQLSQTYKQPESSHVDH